MPRPKKLRPAHYHEALRRTGGAVREAAELLGVVPSAVSQAAKRHGLRVRGRGGPRRNSVCWTDAAPLRPGEFAKLLRDVGVCQLASLLDVSRAAVSLRALRAGLRRKRVDPVGRSAHRGRAGGGLGTSPPVLV